MGSCRSQPSIPHHIPTIKAYNFSPTLLSPWAIPHVLNALLDLFSISVKYACLVSKKSTVFSQTANRNSSVVLQFPPVSYTNPSFPQTDCSTACFMMVSCLVYSSTLTTDTNVPPKHWVPVPFNEN
jgi:hypothetical protein